MRKKKEKLILNWIWKFVVGVLLILVFFSVSQVLVFKYLNPPVTVNMIWEEMLAKIDKTTFIKHKYSWRKLAKISPNLKRAVIASEDQRFLTHNGFDFKELKVVIKKMDSQHKFRGASTISMQAARSLFLPSSRSFVRKFAEIWYTVLIELFWSKPRIFEIYLNTVDWGTHIVGAQAAARAYFSCNADQLTKNQAALMAAILPSPHRWSAKNPSPYIRKRQQHILEQMPAMPLL
ncbi:MAG: monofunctional biosynthetic peptidoglycan transglycosylase [Desulfobacteraceae bacterium]|nr:monofunctional biosynthetic peptidoglycan transglycosylase [Desulfobacteraceae bacterium]